MSDEVCGWYFAKNVFDDETGDVEDHELSVKRIYGPLEELCDACGMTVAKFIVKHVAPGVPFEEYLCLQCTQAKTFFYNKE